MDEPARTHASTPSSADPEEALRDIGHPRGTLLIVSLFGLLFALGWLAMYLFRFLERGAPRS